MYPLEQYQEEQAQAYERAEYRDAAAHLQVAVLCEIALQLRELNEHLKDVKKMLTDGSVTMDR